MNDLHHPNQFATRVLDRIEQERVRPRPRWEFTLKNYFFWSLGALAVILGALAFATALFKVTAVDWRLSPITHASFWSFLIEVMPFLWIGALALFVLIGYRNIRWTNHGYRYSLAVITLGAVLSSLTVGTGLFLFGMGSVVDEAIGDHPPFYRPAGALERSWWLAPEQGFLIGSIITQTPDGASFILRDFSGQLWTVDEIEIGAPDRATVARGGVVRVVGLPVSLNQGTGGAGETEAAPMATSSEFHACFVFPWTGRGGPVGGSPSLLPLNGVASTSGGLGVHATTTPNGTCSGVRSYQQLRALDDARE